MLKHREIEEGHCSLESSVFHDNEKVRQVENHRKTFLAIYISKHFHILNFSNAYFAKS